MGDTGHACPWSTGGCRTPPAPAQRVPSLRPWGSLWWDPGLSSEPPPQYCRAPSTQRAPPRATSAPDRKKLASSHCFIVIPPSCDWLRAGAGGAGLAGSSSPCRGIGRSCTRAAPPGLRGRAGGPARSSRGPEGKTRGPSEVPALLPPPPARARPHPAPPAPRGEAPGKGPVLRPHAHINPGTEPRERGDQAELSAPARLLLRSPRPGGRGERRAAGTGGMPGVAIRIRVCGERGRAGAVRVSAGAGAAPPPPPEPRRAAAGWPRPRSRCCCCSSWRYSEGALSEEAPHRSPG